MNSDTMESEKPDNGPHVLKYFGKRLAELAEIGTGATVLDLGMGRGSSLFPALKKVGSNGQIIGIDISDEMVRKTAVEIKGYNIKNASLIQTDAKTLVFKDKTFDVVLSGFSYTYSTLEEVLRVLKEGGQFGLTTWDTLEDMEWMAAFLRRYIDSDSKKVYHQDTAEGLERLLRDAGFKNVKTVIEKEEFAYRDEEQWWEDMQDSGWRSHLEKIESMGPGKLEEFRKEAFKGLQAHKDADGIHFTVSVLFAFGTK